MKVMPFLVLLTFLLVSCGTLPVIKTLPSSTEQKNSGCPSPFLQEPLRLVHAIETRMAGETTGTVIGITLADPATRFISCAILTAEGIVLFEAQAAPMLKVFRALPPFDSVGFAQNMIEDIQLIFLPPAGKMQEKGILDDGTRICRYREGGGSWIDVLANKAQNIAINKYSADGNLKRQIKLGPTKENIYQRIELTAEENLNYALTMTLLEMGPVEGGLVKEEAEGGAK